MSNYTFQALPESLREFADRILVGAEVVDATGEVKLIWHDRNPNDTHVQSVFLHLSSRQTRDLAEVIFAAAQEADGAVERAATADVLDRLRAQRAEALARHQEGRGRPHGLCPACRSLVPLEDDGTTIAAHDAVPLTPPVPCLGAGMPRNGEGTP